MASSNVLDKDMDMNSSSNSLGTLVSWMGEPELVLQTKKVSQLTYQPAYKTTKLALSNSL